MTVNRYFRAGFWRGCFFAAACLLGAGCTSIPKVQAVAGSPLARLVIENRTNYEWNVTATSESGKTSSVRLDPRATVALSLPAGGYQVEQSTHAGVPDGRPLVRTLPIVLAAGVSYRWPLRTLLADESALIP